MTLPAGAPPAVRFVVQHGSGVKIGHHQPVDLGPDAPEPALQPDAVPSAGLPPELSGPLGALDGPILQRGEDPAPRLAGLVIDQPRAPGGGWMHVDLRPVQPTHFLVVAAAELHAGISGRFGKAAHLELEDKVLILPVGDEPDIVVLFPPERVAQDRAVARLPEDFCAVGRPGRDMPAIESSAVKQGLPLAAARRPGRRQQDKDEPHGAQGIRTALRFR